MDNLSSKLEQSSFRNEASHLVNQTQHQEIQGGQHIYIRERSPHPTAAASPSRCVSIPFATVPTYTERPHLSEELGVKLGKRHGGAGLAYAAALIGLSGAGKTQLVLRFIEEHEKDYNTVLWIDVGSQETARSSYERCCRTIDLPVEAPTNDGPLHHTPVVQAVLSWLQSRNEDDKWLTVVDNADDLSWDVSSIVPKGKAGTVIMTSQDAQASRLLGGRTPTVKVDAMEPEEAVRLVLNYFDEAVCRKNGCRALVQEITERLDRLALAIDLAGARVRVDVENGDDLATALRQYLADYRRSQAQLFRDEDLAHTSTYKKTVWTAWEISLASLRKVEDSHPGFYPVKLLNFVTLLDRANIQDELFRLASLGLEDACHRLNIRVPAWVQWIFNIGDEGQWNDFSYRASKKWLLRYGLVRPVGEPWKGITMHSLVQWRAGAGADREQYWRLYLAFMAAVCMNIGRDADTVRFRRHVVVHLSLMNDLLNGPGGAEEEGLWWMCSWVGRVLSREGRWKEAEELQVKVVEAMSRVLGDEHPDTITMMANLAVTYRKQGRWKEAEGLEVVGLGAMSRALGEEHPDTVSAMGNLAATYRKQGRLKEAEELQVKVMVARWRSLGEEHPKSLDAKASLAKTYQNQERFNEAEGLEVVVWEARRRILGGEHPDTVSAMGNLAVTYRKQGRLREAEGLEVVVMEAKSRALGDEHPDTISAMANLAATYRKQGRLREADGLEVVVMEAKSRALGDEHPDTISAMANLTL